jgi:hypothetical protein
MESQSSSTSSPDIDPLSHNHQSQPEKPDLIKAPLKQKNTTNNSATSPYLESLCISMLEKFHTRDFSDPIWSHLSPNYHNTHSDDILPPVEQPSGLLQRMRDYESVTQEFRIEVLTVGSVVYSRGRAAKVWFTYLICGLPCGGLQGAVREKIGEMRFRKTEKAQGERGGKWLAVSSQSMHGPCGFAW